MFVRRSRKTPDTLWPESGRLDWTRSAAWDCMHRDGHQKRWDNALCPWARSIFKVKIINKRKQVTLLPNLTQGTLKRIITDCTKVYRKECTSFFLACICMSFLQFPPQCKNMSKSTGCDDWPPVQGVFPSHFQWPLWLFRTENDFTAS